LQIVVRTDGGCWRQPSGPHDGSRSLEVTAATEEVELRRREEGGEPVVARASDEGLGQVEVRRGGLELSGGEEHLAGSDVGVQDITAHRGGAGDLHGADGVAARTAK